MDPHIRELVEKVWNYHRLNHTLAPADAIMVLCSHDTVVAERGAQVFLEGWAPLLIFSGGLGTITKNFWTEPEADQFAAIAVRMGVPRDKILIEKYAGSDVKLVGKDHIIVREDDVLGVLEEGLEEGIQ